MNVPGSPLTSVVDAVLDLGDERDSKASTIGFTGTLAALGLLADAWEAPAPPSRTAGHGSRTTSRRCSGTPARPSTG
ncbi:hypothetical protein GCM10025868_29420 [Angustibacter aerolatus]|uniref:Uncharacterized protein n=1 Tax=Angustibacter aerolatus TaxID=1162965 RepID=A0ABQ6JLG8_9ACTN|nr:hypothetical protein GCM10025868_29420 [Angustibacter aerolatus]